MDEIKYLENLNVEHYTDTRQYRWDRDRLWLAIGIVLQYNGEQNIRDGNAVSQEDIDAEISDIFDFRTGDMYQALYNEGHYEITQNMLWEKFQKDYKYVIDPANIKIVLIRRQLAEFRDAVYELEHTREIYYYIKTDQTLLYNKAYTSITDNELSLHQTIYANDRETVVSQGAFVFSEQYLNERNTAFLSAKQEVTRALIKIGAGLIVFLLSLAYLIYAAGKRAVSPEGVRHVFADRLYNEFTAAALFGAGLAVFGCIYVIVRELFNKSVMYILLAASVLLMTAFLLMLVRHIKSRTLLKHTAVFSFFRYIFRAVKKVFDAGPVMVKAFVLILVLGLLTAVPFVILITLPFVMITTYAEVKKYIAIKNGVKLIKDGVYDQKIQTTGNGELTDLAADINDISAGLGAEVERRLKSERLKTELIVNVSHDIKTPLTSVITYVDLLQKEDIGNENARNYIEVIAGKSDRLKTLIDDLFDASKAASGNIPVNLEEVDIHALLTQGLGELDDRIKASSLDFKVNLPPGRITAYADGRLTWRVLENLLSNVFKYSLAQSRVYIDVFEEERYACVEIKNISAAALNIPEDEIIERFKRGDESRSSDGSGLGLDIARSLMLCQNGQLTIKIDGDLFKAKVKIPKMAP